MDLLIPVPFTKTKVGLRLHRGNGWHMAEGGIYGQRNETAITCGVKAEHAAAAFRRTSDAFQVSPKPTTA